MNYDSGLSASDVALITGRNGSNGNGFGDAFGGNGAWCCNPDHLKIGTHKENCQDIVDCGRSLKGKENKKIRGINNGANKLKENDVIEIYLSKEKNSVLAKKYNVSKTNIIYIKKKKQWKWLTDKLD